MMKGGIMKTLGKIVYNDIINIDKSTHMGAFLFLLAQNNTYYIINKKN